jgi:hypothetical protein
LAYPIEPPDYNIGPLMLESTAESIATLCYATALISFKPDLAPEEQPWRPSALVQVLVNVWLALGREMQNPASNLSQTQLDMLCDTLHHVLRFRGNPARTTPIDMFMPEQYQCIFNPAIRPCPPEGVPALTGGEGVKWFKRIPTLTENHTLGSPLYACQPAA